MNLRDLKYLVALADCKSFSKAADICFVSQPALSMQIKKLESTLGVQLIERANKSVLLTAIGKKIASEAMDILLRVESIHELADQSKDPFSGEFNLGALPTLAPYLFPYILPYLSSQIISKLKIYLAEQQTDQLIVNLKQGKIDAAVISLPHIEKDLITLPLFEEEFMLAVPVGHPLAKRKSLKHTELKDHTLLLLEEGHCMREQTLLFCHKAHAHEEQAFRATSLETLRYMVASHVGITLMPKTACHRHEQICYIPFINPKPSRTLGLILRPSSSKMLLTERLASKIKEAVKKHKLGNLVA